MKVTSLLLLLTTTLSPAFAVDKVEYRGRIIEASACSQNKDSTYFTSAKRRALKCKRIKLPDNDICDAVVTNTQTPTKIALDVPGLTHHKGTRRGRINFNKGGVIVYESKKRVGAFHNKPGIFSSQKSGDQLEFELTSSGSSSPFQLERAALYLDHDVKGSRMSWTEYVCSF